MGGPAFIDGKVVECTDNFYICQFKVEGVRYFSAEHFYQASKCTNEKDKSFVRKASSGMNAWKRGNSVETRTDWEAVKLDLMYKGNIEKFRQIERLKEILVSTKGKIKCGGSSSFWNKWNAVILERVREELKEKKDRDEEKITSLTMDMQNYRKKMEEKLESSGKK